jgi:hypothetical protein
MYKSKHDHVKSVTEAKTVSLDLCRLGWVRHTEQCPDSAIHSQLFTPQNRLASAGPVS